MTKIEKGTRWKSHLEKYLESLTEGIWKQNPVFKMTLGLCPALAVTISIENALTMGVATVFVLVCSNTLVSIIKKIVSHEVRIMVYILIIVTFVIIVDYAIQAYSIDLYNSLGAFISLIVVNCIVLGRAESYASKNPVFMSFLNALGMGVGFTLALVCMSVTRELLGTGTLMGIQIMSENFQPWLIMTSPPSGFFVLGGILTLIKYMEKRKEVVIHG